MMLQRNNSGTLMLYWVKTYSQKFIYDTRSMHTSLCTTQMFCVNYSLPDNVTTKNKFYQKHYYALLFHQNTFTMKSNYKIGSWNEASEL